MIYFHDTTQFHIDGPCAVTLGKFDGVHLGHMKLMRQVLAYAASHEGCKSVVFSLNARDEQLILTPSEQRAYLEKLGIDCLVQCPFVPEIYTMTPDTFVRQILLDALGAVCVTVGSDFRFGHGRAGDAQFLRQEGEKLGFSAAVMDHELYEGRKISSSYVREALSEGNVRLANALLGRTFSVRGTVVHGTHLGTTMGMPTANIIPDKCKLLPRRGVYVSLTHMDGKTLPSITNVGVKPTVHGAFEGAETFIYGSFGELYGKEIRVELLDFFREETKFASVEALKEQIAQDIKRGEEYFEREKPVLS